MANPDHLKILKQGVEVWNQWREESPETRPDLSREKLAQLDLPQADLRDVDFSHSYLRGGSFPLADMRRADLRGADMKCAFLVRTNLGSAVLVDTDIQSSDLGNAQLAEADLRNANLSHAECRASNFAHANLKFTELTGTNLVFANLVCADFTGAQMGGTQLDCVDLSQARGLEKVRHAGPSSIGTDTLLRSQGRIAEVFLRGAGLPENLIQYLPSLIAPWAIDFYSCFISYSHSDVILAHQLYSRLQARGIRCWLDEHDLKPGDRILDVVSNAIRLHDRILLCCSEASLESWWVKDEIRKAQERERRDGCDIIIPLMVDRYLLDGWEDGMAADLRSRLAADFSGWERDNARFEEQFEKVVKALRADEKAREQPPDPKL